MNNIADTKEFSPIRRAARMVGREAEWARLAATLTPGGPLRVVLVRGRGGLGKSRLLEEVVRAAKREPLAADVPERAFPFAIGDVVVSDIINASEVEYHDRYKFVSALRDRMGRAYRGQLNFAGFDAQRGKINNLRANGALYNEMVAAEERMVDAFLTDLRAITRSRRVVFLIDTVERLVYAGPKWLLAEGILRPTDLDIRAYHWLLNVIAQRELENVTLILAGRDQTNEYDDNPGQLEGRDFFDDIREAIGKAQEAGRACELTDIQLQSLSYEATREFFAQYAEQSRDWPQLAAAYRRVADPDLDYYKVIRLYTRGIPLRLSLCAHIIAEGKTIPAAFSDSFDEARRKTGLPSGESGVFAAHEADDLALTPELRKVEWELEEEFLEVFFGRPESLRRQMVLILLRAPRGLRARQLHYLIHTSEDRSTWAHYLSQPDDPARENEIREYWELGQEIAEEYWAKDLGSELGETVEEDLENLPRIRLQDEFYRLYAEHMGLFAEPLSPETAVIRQILAGEADSYTRSHDREQAERQVMYEKLAFYADYHYQPLLARKQAYLDEDEARFEDNFILDRPNTYAFPSLSLSQQFERLDLNEALTGYEIERMVYRLLLHPDDNLNSEYITLEDDNDTAVRHEVDFWAQAEMWRAVHEPWSIKFAPLHDRELAKQRGQTAVEVLWRVAEQESVARWIKRFVLRGAARRAIEFSADVEAFIENMPRGEEKTPEGNAYRSWNHTLAREERAIWTQVAHTRLGRDVGTAIEAIKKSVGQLLTLYLTPVKQPLFPGGTPPPGEEATPLPEVEWIVKPLPIESKDKEYGFGPGPGGERAHPAYTRLQRLLSHAHNALGYSYRTLGEMHEAVVYYAAALEIIRTDHIERDLQSAALLNGITGARSPLGLVGQSDALEMTAHRGKVLNNLSRPLSELGWNSLGVCLDGLELRRKMAEEVPLAGSYNTLALIYDDLGRYEDAPLLSAKAIAYCRRAAEKRQLGLSLRQMAESLRHVAERLRTRQRAAGSADSLLDAAEELLNEARNIFYELGEVERQVEVNIEFGSLLRDRLDIAAQDADKARAERVRRLYNSEALSLLDIAERDAREAGLWQHVLDAQVNQARVHFYANNTPAAEAIVDRIMTTEAYQTHIIRPHVWPEELKKQVDEARRLLYEGDQAAAEVVLAFLAEEEKDMPEPAEPEWPTDPDLRNKNWAFRQLSTAQRVRGQIALRRFQERVKALKEKHREVSRQERAKKVVNDQVAKDALAAAATAYALAYAYAVLYSSRSRTIASLEGDLYNRTRKFNRSELDALRGHLRAVAVDYPALAEHSLPALDQFMDEFFGRGLEMPQQPRENHEQSS